MQTDGEDAQPVTPAPRRGRPPRVREEVPTRARIVAGAARLLRQRGYYAMGLNDVVAQSRAPKGSLYHYFPGGKEQIASEAIRAGGTAVAERIAKALAASDDPVESLRLFATVLAEDLERSEFRDGSPIASTALDAASESDAIQSACADCYDAWRDTIIGWLVGRGRDRDEATELALLLVSAFEGALIMARARRDVAPLYGIADSLGRRLEL